MNIVGNITTAEADAMREAHERIIQTCARHAHEVNRAYCAAIGDHSQLPWHEAPSWQRDSAIAGSRALVLDQSRTPEQSHEGWLEHKLADGWRYGTAKDPGLKTHPCMVQYAVLPPEQRAKDHIFRAAVLGMFEALSSH